MTLIIWSLNETKNVEAKGKRLIENQKKLLSLFDYLKTMRMRMRVRV